MTRTNEIKTNVLSSIGLDRKVIMEMFDDLPKELRDAINYSNGKYSCAYVIKCLIDGISPSRIIDDLEYSDSLLQKETNRLYSRPIQWKGKL